MANCRSLWAPCSSSFSQSFDRAMADEELSGVFFVGPVLSYQMQNPPFGCSQACQAGLRLLQRGDLVLTSNHPVRDSWAEINGSCSDGPQAQQHQVQSVFF